MFDGTAEHEVAEHECFFLFFYYLFLFFIIIYYYFTIWYKSQKLF